MYWFVFSEGNLLLTADGSLPFGSEPPVALEQGCYVQELPNFEGIPCKAVRWNGSGCESGSFVDLRTTFDILPRPLYQLAGKAAELLYWDTKTKFCSKCGNLLVRRSDISKICLSCGTEVWPQLATAIIVAVTHNDKILLVQSRNFRGDYMGLIAGFVETGENLEECVQREIKEETQINVKNIQYVASQPWPYPCGLMIGFFAEYESGELRLQYSELTKGGWFRYDELPAIPGKVSLARRLIDIWVNRMRVNEV
jgi:NAD+ diphosphatase